MTVERSRAEWIRRYLSFVVILFVIALGTSLSIRANLGSSPISAPPYILSLIPGMGLTMGQLIAGAGILMTASGLVYWICRSSFSVDQKKSHWVILFLILFVLLCLGVFLRQPIAVIPVTAIVVFIVVLFLVYKLLDSRLD